MRSGDRGIGIRGNGREGVRRRGALGMIGAKGMGSTGNFLRGEGESAACGRGRYGRVG